MSRSPSMRGTPRPNPLIGSFSHRAACGQRRFVHAWSECRVAAGHRHACALGTDSSITCWGQDPLDTGLTQPPSGAYLGIEAGHFHACALSTGLTIACWGGLVDDAEANSDGEDTDPPDADGTAIAVVVSPTTMLLQEGSTTAYEIRLSDDPATPITLNVSIPRANAKRPQSEPIKRA